MELSDEQVDHILRDIRSRGIEMEELQQDLLDHICCILENEQDPEADFETLYKQTIKTFFKTELKEIEEETILLLTFKHFYAMKKVMISTGIISVILFVAGSLFKIMHWPGAGVLLLTGIVLFSILFLPLLFLLKTKDAASPRDKAVTGIAALIGILLCFATLFSVMHWPGGKGMFWLLAVAITVFVLIPLYFFTGIRNPATRANTIVTSIILLAAAGLLFTMINLRPSRNQLEIKMHSYIESEELLRLFRNTGSADTNALANEISSTAEKLKSMILQGTIGMERIPKDFEEQGILVEEGNLGSYFQKDAEGTLLFSRLRTLIADYNENNKNKMSRIPEDHFQGLVGSYSNFVMLNYLVQVQMRIAGAELAEQ